MSIEPGFIGAGERNGRPRIKMIVTDLDNTLLRADKTISDYSANVLKRCRERGVIVAFATARPTRAAASYAAQIPADALIVHNGAVIYAGDAPLGRFGIAPALRNQILLSLNRDFPGAPLSVEIDDVLYANFNVHTVWPNTPAVNTDFTGLPDKPADKIIIGLSSPEVLEQYSAYIPDELYIENCEGRLGLIMHRDATKQAALRVAAGHFNILAGEIAAFGDDYNDVEMLRFCGVGVAVANALDAAKAAADYICGDCDCDGVAKWLEGNVLCG